MKLIRIIPTLLLLLCLGNLYAQGWRHVYTASETNGYENDRACSIVQTPDSGYLSLVEMAASSPVKLFKIDKNGVFQWFKSLQISQLVAIEKELLPLYDQSYLVVTHNFTDSLILLRVDAEGNTLVSKTFPYELNRVYAADSAGFVMMYQYSSFQTIIDQYDLNFNLLWTKTFNNPGDASNVGKIYIGTDQSIYYSTQKSYSNTTDVWINKLSSNGDLIWTRAYTGLEATSSDLGLLVNAAGEIYYLTNYLITNVPARYGTALYKFDHTGNLLWKRNLADYQESCKLTPDGGIAIISHRNDNPFSLYSPSTLRVFKPNGQLKVETRYLGPYGATIMGQDLSPTNDGGYIIAGEELYFNVYLKTDSLGRIQPNYLQGKVKYDINHNCVNDTNEDPLQNWIVSAEQPNGLAYYAVTDSGGNYEINVDTGLYMVKIHSPGPVWEPCNGGVYQADLSMMFDTVVVNMPVQDSAYCSLLNVQVAAGRLRRCFNNTYWLNWQNNGTAAADNVRIDVVLPPELDFVSSNSLQPLQLGDTLRFDIGTVPYGASGSLAFVVHVDCDATMLGQTLCVEAWISPDTLCSKPPAWSGAEVIANARCTSDTTVQYTLKNVGEGPTGDLNYIITEDLVVLMTQPFSLNPNQEIQINQAFSGNLQRIIAEQAPNYPFDPVSAAAVETCGGSTNGLGQINQFPLTDGSPFVDIECSTVVGSYDPNDKTGFPIGYGPDHLIEANTDLTYLIRFQNTGTDTAFRVVVRDTLSQWLDVVSVQPGPASHPYRWNFEDGNVLVFHFDPIALPDSNVNQDASNGFVQFRIKQKPNLTDGTEILNTADIYFDYNAAVRTNTTIHRIGKFEYTVSVFPEPSLSALVVTVSPNPFSAQTTLRLERAQNVDLSFELYDQQGRLVRSAAFKGGQYELSAEGLHAGMYTYVLMDERGAVQSRGKLIVSAR